MVSALIVSMQGRRSARLHVLQNERRDRQVGGDAGMYCTVQGHRLGNGVRSACLPDLHDRQLGGDAGTR